MDDVRIIELLFARSESALDEVARKYSRLYMGILRGILADEGDREECANDVLFAVWNSIPPSRPSSLLAYVCKLARRIGIDRFRYNTGKKRNSEYVQSLSELEEALPAEPHAEDTRAQSETVRDVLSAFLRALDPETRILFVRRYVTLESVAELALRFDLDENRVSVKLYRARRRLKRMLEKEGIKV